MKTGGMLKLTLVVAAAVPLLAIAGCQEDGPGLGVVYLDMTVVAPDLAPNTDLAPAPADYHHS